MIRQSTLTAAALLMLSACNQSATPETKTGNASTAAAPVDSKWLETTAKTPEGGMVMGNPAAKVKLIEYGALSCSHCAEFAQESGNELKALIAKGTVSYEYRPFLLNALDVPSTLLARCGGPGPFFPISDKLYEAQAEWLGRTKDITPAEQKAFETMAPQAQIALLAEKLKLIEFVGALGIGAEKAKACLSDAAALEELGKISEQGQKEFKVSGTPTFVLNGSTLPNMRWEELKGKLSAAGA